MSIAFAQSPTTTPRPQKLFTSPLDRNRLQIVHISDFTRSNARRFVRDERKSPRLRIRVFPSGESIDGSPQREASGELSLDAILSMTEMLFIIPPAVYSVRCIIGFLIPIVVKPLPASLGSNIFVWQFLLLVGSVSIGSLIRRRQWRRICRESENTVGVDLLARIKKVEDDMRSSATIVRVLSRQLEKLGIRFRITRKALKEPIAEEQQKKQLDLILAIGKAGRLFENKRDTDRAATIPIPCDESKQLERRPETLRHSQ